MEKEFRDHKKFETNSTKKISKAINTVHTTVVLIVSPKILNIAASRK